MRASCLSACRSAPVARDWSQRARIGADLHQSPPLQLADGQISMHTLTQAFAISENHVMNDRLPSTRRAGRWYVTFSC